MLEKFTIFGFPLSTFSLLLMAAFLTAAYLVPRELRRRGLDEAMGDHSLLLAVVGTIIGAKLGFVLEVWGEIWAGPDDFWTKLEYILFYKRGLAALYPQAGYRGLWETVFSGGGLVFYGGFAVGFAFLYYYLRYKKAPVWEYGDAFIPSMAIGYGIGRLGCIVSGDGCFGYGASVDIPFLTMVYEGPTDHRVFSWLSITTGGLMGTHGVNVWNTPMMEAILSWILFAWMMLKLRHQNFKPGFMVAIFLVWNGIARFLVEFLRINDALIPILDHPSYKGQLIEHHTHGAVQGAIYFENWHWYGFTQSQVFGLIIALVGLIWIVQQKLYIRNNAAKN
ncbi:MAG: prolipoprotein diacylglyceryl transferase [Leptospiraceae bacterium]|nr:prolipoprotein diacylglyceryl transferase [Leptospiraceae bacterium]